MIACAGGLWSAPSSIAAELPNLGDGSSAISLSEEKQLGQIWLQKLRSGLPQIRDWYVQQYVQDLTYILVPNSGLSFSSGIASSLTEGRLGATDIRVITIDSSELNAFAVPGGIIGINAGLFLYARTEQEFASVVAHELAHLSQRHFARRQEASSKTTALSIASMVASIIIAATSGSGAGVAALASSQAYAINRALAYSRDNEREADRFGLQTLVASDMDGESMVHMFKRMADASRYSNRVPEYLRTHPLTENRISDMASFASKAPRGHYREQPEYYFAQARARTELSTDARALYDSLERTAENATGLQALGTRYALVASAVKTGDEKLIRTQADRLDNLRSEQGWSIAVTLLEAEYEAALGDRKAAIDTVADKLRATPGNYPLQRTLADLYYEERDYDAALTQLEALKLSSPDEPSLWYDLAEVYGLVGNIQAVHIARAEYFMLNGRLRNADDQLRQALGKSSDYRQKSLVQAKLSEVEQMARLHTKILGRPADLY